MDTGSHPRQNHQHITDSMAHDGGVLQRLTNGDIAIKGHEEEHKDLHAAKEMGCKDLSHALIVGDGLLLRKGVHNQSGGCGCRETGISKGQIEQEKIHGTVKGPAYFDSHYNEKVPHQCRKVKHQEDPKDCFLLSCILCQPKQNELDHTVIHHHTSS